jgi:hypothetical protein
VRAGRAAVRGRDRGRARAPTLPEEDYTGRKVAFPLDDSVWPDYSRLLEFIKKNKRLQVLNGVPQPDSLEDEKNVAIVGKRRTQAPKKKYEMCFEYSSFKSMFMKMDVIEHFLVEGDVAPEKSTLSPSEVSIEGRGGTASIRASTRVTAVKRARGTYPGFSTLPESPPLTRVTSTVNDNAALTPRRRGGTASQPIRTPTTTHVSHMIGYAPQIRHFFTKVAVKELGDCPGSESDDDEKNPSQGFYMNLLVSGDPWTTHAGISEDTVSIEEEDDVAYVEKNLADGEVDSHHGFYWKVMAFSKNPNARCRRRMGDSRQSS